MFLNKEKYAKLLCHTFLGSFLEIIPPKKIAYNCECSSPKCTSKNVKKSCDILVMEKSITYQFFFLRQLFSQMIGMFNFSVGGVKNHKGHTQTENSFHERIFNFEDEHVFLKIIRSLTCPKCEHKLCLGKWESLILTKIENLDFQFEQFRHAKNIWFGNFRRLKFT